LINCCATPLAPGPGNIAADPAFLNTNGLSTLRLSSNSPCINSGNNAFAAGPTDLDGNPRIAGGTVDMGAYEFQSPASILAYAWAQQYALPTDGSADALDLDGTGMANWQKSVAGLNPTNPASVLVMSAVAPHGPAGLTVTWASVNNRWYLLQQSTNLSASPAFWTVQSNILGQAGVTSYTNAAATNGGPYFYRVGVQ
jgi:hypothetical protein